MKLVFVGVSGAGKGTQAKEICSIYNIAHISTGDILRSHIQNKTELGLQVKEIMDSGKLVSDEIVIKLVQMRINEDDCKNGFILDGFPRTLSQAKMLDNITDLDKVVYIKANDEDIVKRLSGRLICEKCGSMYHKIYSKPKVNNICDNCGDSLIQRQDDKEETVRERLRIFHEMTAPVIDFYRNKKLLAEVNGIGDIKEITNSIVKALEE